MDTLTIDRPSGSREADAVGRGRGQDRQSGPSGRWRPRRLHLGCPGPSAGGRADLVRGRVRHQCRSDERGGARLRSRRRRPGGCEEGAQRFWLRVSHAAAMGPLQPSAIDRALHNHAVEYSPAFVVLDFMTRVFSPYQLNPANLQPAAARAGAVGRLRAAARAVAGQAVPLGDQRPHRQGEGVHQPGDHREAVMASACLPFMFQAVEIDGEAYWDGGYMGNPAIYPLIYHCDSARTCLSFTSIRSAARTSRAAPPRS